MGSSGLKKTRVVLKLRGLARKRWVRYLLYATGVVMVAFGGTFFYFYFSYADLIEQRLHGERERTLPRVYGRAVQLRRGQMLSVEDLVSRLNDLGYAQRQQIDGVGQFTVARNTVTISPREGPLVNRSIRLVFPQPRPVKAGRGAATPPPPPRGIQQIEIRGRGNVQSVELDPPLLTALMADGAREKRRHVTLATIPPRMRQAVMAIEDQRFYSHFGISPVRLMAAAIRNIRNSDDAPVGYSTITQQLARMFFLSEEFNAELRSGERGRTWASRLRKLREIMMALALERRASKDEILEMYLNDVYLGQRGSFAVHGVAEASRIYFGKDVSNITNSEAAMIAGSIQLPGLPFTNPKRATERRNTVLQAMASEEYITPEAATSASREPLSIVPRAVDNESPYFVDMIVQQVEAAYPGLMAQSAEINVFTTLDLNLQRAALEAVRNGLNTVDLQLSKRRRKYPDRPQAALIAVDPRTGEILALVGGRSYNTSQYNRVTTARRQPGSVFKPFVYLAAFERGVEEGRTDLTPASLTWDEPAVFEYDGQVWEPKNYDDYDGEVTWRRALAMSRNLGTVRVGELVGFDTVARLWRRVGVGTPPQAFPSITLGVFELTPLEVAQAYTLFTNNGNVRPLIGLNYIQAGARVLRPTPPTVKPVARSDTTFLVTNMLRSVLNEGTGASARANGFSQDGAGKSGTTNDQRDAWFVGFTPELLTAVWVGFDDNTPIGLTGSQAALPIWTEFMKAALAGRTSSQFSAPEGISFVLIDRDTGKLASPNCPRTFTESFITGTEPLEICPLH
ncbi:MAG TPA: transglycosylase domain-containing protein [Vicinamibacterales bacterium]|nr:transglycosylase domain-containing protein [Vicinamibacterales bacterium]